MFNITTSSNNALVKIQSILLQKYVITIGNIQGVGENIASGVIEILDNSNLKSQKLKLIETKDSILTAVPIQKESKAKGIEDAAEEEEQITPFDFSEKKSVLESYLVIRVSEATICGVSRGLDIFKEILSEVS